jgi:branched-chain amino acid aminotransferase
MFDKKGYILNGQFKSIDINQNDFINRAFLYGDLIFETMYAADDRILFFNDHIQRLKNGMQVLQYEIPSFFDLHPEQLESDILRLLFQNKIFGHARIRLNVFRKNGGYYTPETNEVNYLVTADSVAGSNYVLNKQGLKTEIFKQIRKPINIFSPYKISNALLYTMSGIYNKSNQIDESFILNETGNIIESTSSNVFIVNNDILISPPITEGCIDGVMRKNIILTAKKSGITIFERAILQEDLLNAEEIFLSNVIKGIRWVVAFKQRRYYKKMSEFLIREINAQFFAR